MNGPKNIFAWLAMALFSSSVSAQGSPEWHDWATGDRFRVAAGYFAPNLDTQLIVTDAEGSIGTGISFEDNLGLDDSKSTGLLSVDWRFFKRHTLAYNYFDLQRSATTSSSVSIAVGDEIFDISLPIQSFFDITAHELAYSYSLIFDERRELYLGAGLSIQDLALGLQGTASSPNPGEIINSTLDSTAPLPTLNIGFNYAFTENWVFLSKLGWLEVELDLGADEDLSGRIINANAGIWWKAFNNIGIYAMYQLFDVNVDYVDVGARFAVDYNYNGPVLGASISF